MSVFPPPPPPKSATASLVQHKAMTSTHSQTLPPNMTTMKWRGRALYPSACDATEWTSRIYQYASLDITRADHQVLFSLLYFWELIEKKLKTRLCSRWRPSVHGDKLSSPESLEQNKLHSVACIELHWYPWSPVTSGNFLHCCATSIIICLSIYHCRISPHALVVT